ncbi:hypothetical protein BDA96_09G092400 [Sorghum bicolor]|uniref:Uncharacterized protein n=2 Tax=Sorghum bicolor TaxID=4558 RepID=A0A921Q963_SORBI|nr:hypothetical protein BDA96_09G092400 [Sorghum bicolor]OQU77690.1 hypothetical protein SORBI_3009G087850 [Sorghum bicolor]
MVQLALKGGSLWLGNRNRQKKTNHQRPFSSVTSHTTTRFGNGNGVTRGRCFILTCSCGVHRLRGVLRPQRILVVGFSYLGIVDDIGL